MNNQTKKYYKVVVKCGHVGRRHYIPIQFAISAVNGKEASRLARLMPRVKHDRKDAILKCEQINYWDFIELRKINDQDPYLKCQNQHEQSRLIDLIYRLQDEDDETKEFDELERLAVTRFKIKKLLSSEDREGCI